MIYDIVIVGAGPAGLECARILGNSKYKVLIIEKNKFLGDKICAGGISNLTDLDLSCNENKKRFISNSIFSFLDFNFKIYSKVNISILDRKDLSNYQFKRIKNFSNIKLLLDSKVYKISKNYIFLKNKKIKYKYLVGADGSNSIVRKYLNLKSKVTMGKEIFVNNSQINKKLNLEFKFNIKILDFGYLWVFPGHKKTSFGIYYDPLKANYLDIDKLFNNFLKEHGINLEKLNFFIAPINYNYLGYNFGNIFLIGEAAGFTSYFTGEGINRAIISASEIANILLNKNYKYFKLKYLIKMKNIEEKILINSNFYPLKYKYFLLKKIWNIN